MLINIFPLNETRTIQKTFTPICFRPPLQILANFQTMVKNNQTAPCIPYQSEKQMLITVFWEFEINYHIYFISQGYDPQGIAKIIIRRPQAAKHSK